MTDATGMPSDTQRHPIPGSTHSLQHSATPHRVTGVGRVGNGVSHGWKDEVALLVGTRVLVRAPFVAAGAGEATECAKAR